MKRIALYNDSFQNWKSHDILKAQLILTDIPYQLGVNAYGSNPMWYNGGDNSKGESKFAGKSFFDTDSKSGFRISFIYDASEYYVYFVEFYFKQKNEIENKVDTLEKERSK